MLLTLRCNSEWMGIFYKDTFSPADRTRYFEKSSIKIVPDTNSIYCTQHYNLPPFRNFELTNYIQLYTSSPRDPPTVPLLSSLLSSLMFITSQNGSSLATLWKTSSFRRRTTFLQEKWIQEQPTASRKNTKLPEEGEQALLTARLTRDTHCCQGRPQTANILYYLTMKCFPSSEFCGHK